MYSDSEILRLVEEYMHGSNHPDQVGYREQVKVREFSDKDIFLSRLKMLRRLGGFNGKRILDVGCGFGWHAFAFALMGNSVVGIDILPGMIEGMTESAATMKRKGIAFDLTSICGDICNAKLQRQSFDAIYSNEAIEHVHDLEAMFARCRELLKPGGKVYLLNDANVLNRATRTEITSYWKQRESSWEMVGKLKAWRPVEHGDAKPFAVIREEIVRAANPKLDNDEVELVVKGTAGLLKSEIESLAKTFHPAMPFPHIDEFDRCRNPITGEYAERLLDPFKLAKMLRKQGFRAKVRHYFRRLPLNFINGIPFRPLNNCLFNLRPMFIVVGSL
jgi:SAM-dependent methyltransferase